MLKFTKRDRKPFLMMVATMTMFIIFMTKMFVSNHSQIKVSNHSQIKDPLVQQLIQKRSPTIIIELNDKNDLEKTISDMKINGYQLLSTYIETNNELELTFSRVAD